MPWHPAVIGFDFHQNDIRADTADAVPGDAEVIPSAPQPQKAAGAGHDDGLDAPIRDIDLHIRHKPQPPAIRHANDLLAPQIRKFHDHTNASPFL